MLTIMITSSACENLFTPCYIPPQVKAVVRQYEAETGMQLEPNIPWPYDSLWSAGQWKVALAFTQQQRQQLHMNAMKLNEDEYAMLDSTLTLSTKNSETLKTDLFSPSGVIGGTILPGLGLTIGLMIKRSGMVPKAEHLEALAKAKNGGTQPPKNSTGSA